MMPGVITGIPILAQKNDKRDTDFTFEENGNPFIPDPASAVAVAINSVSLIQYGQTADTRIRFGSSSLRNARV